MTGPKVPPEYVAARAVLLDALVALAAHRDAIVLVGAQAVYLHTGDGELAVAPTTTDADIVLAPDRLAPEPRLAEALSGAGFVSDENPGTWRGRGDVAIDIMVPDALSPPGGRRGARLPGHGKQVARKTVGLEAAIAAAGRLRMLAADPIAGAVTRSAIETMREDGRHADGLIASLAARAVPADDWDITTQSVAVLVVELLESLDTGTVPDRN